MNERNRLLKRLDLMRECSGLRLDAPTDWKCLGCFQKHPAITLEEVEALLTSDKPLSFDNCLLHAEIYQDNGVTLYVCATCLVRAAAKDNETFRTIYPGEFEARKISAKAQRRFMAVYEGYKDCEGGLVDAIIDMYKVKHADGTPFEIHQKGEEEC